MLGAVALVALGCLTTARSASAATGDSVHETDFSQSCASGIGVGVAYDGAGHLWVSCYASNPDLLRADAVTGVVDQTYNIEGGLGALAYDATRNALWAGPGCGSSSAIQLIQLDATKSVTGSSAAFTPGLPGCLDDGLAYDASDDTLYYSPDASTQIEQDKTDGTHLRTFSWTGSGCYNSGLAIGGNLLFQGSDGCSHVWVVDKNTLAPAFDFATGGVRDEGLSCDPNTFASQGKQVMWSKEAYSPNRAFAFEIPSGTCGAGGQPPPPPGDKAISATGGNTFTGTEPASVNGTVATFTDPDPASQASEYSATISWGDGNTSTGTISGPAGGPFTVTGSNTYADEGSYATSVTITDTDNTSNSATVTGTATVGDASLTPTGFISPGSVSGQSVHVSAGFTDANTTSTTADFTATIDWGDGSPASTGTVSGGGGSYSVTGSHTYAGTGYFTIKVHVADDGGSTADQQAKVLVYGTAAGGSFVISSQKAAAGTAVTFWGAQWAKLNPLSSPAPSQFKGFEDQPALGSCGVAWKTDPGNSTPPPPGPLPAYMAVIVSSSITSSGSVITGNTVSLVVVKTNPGYQPDPAYPGTGTVVAKIC
jgi:hypothetical protein